MDNILKIFLLLLLLLQVILIVNVVKRKKLSIKYACFWIFLIIVMSVVVIFPDFVFKLLELFRFEAASNMIFLLGFFFLFYIIFIITTSISIQNEKIKILIQEISLLEERIEGQNGKKE